MPNSIYAGILCILILTAIMIFLKIVDLLIYFILYKWKRIKNSFRRSYNAKMKRKISAKVNDLNKQLNDLAKVNQFITPEMEKIASDIKGYVEKIKKFAPTEKSDLEKADAIMQADVALSTMIFNKIDEMILLETQHILLPLASLGTNIDVRNYADHVESVITAVRDGLNIGIYKSKTMFTPKYINSYIIKRSAIVVLSVMTDLNKQLPPPQ